MAGAISADCYLYASSVSKSLGGTPILRDVTLTVGSGEVVALLGVSGSGKTTLLKLLAGITKPDVGTIEIGNVSAVEHKRNGSIGFVFQSPVLLPWRTVFENVVLPLEILGRHSTASTETMAILDRLGLEGYHDRYPADLSGGMQSRVAIARVLVHEPSLLLMDEPFKSQDEMTKEVLTLVMLEAIEKRRITCVVVTHSIEQAVFFADRVLVLGGSPSHVCGEITIDIAKPRTPDLFEDEIFREYAICVRKLLRSVY